MKNTNNIIIPQNEIELKKIFDNYSNSYIIENYSKNDIINMYIIIYGKKPLSRFDKKGIVSIISNFFHELIRAEALSTV